MTSIKNYVTLLLCLMTMLFAPPASAACTTPPIITGGIIGTKSASAPNAEYISMAMAHTSPSVERYSIDFFTNFGGPYKMSFGAGSAVDVRFGLECSTALGGYTCVTSWAPQRITKVDFPVTYAGDTGNIPVTRVFLNDAKVMEWWHATVVPSGDRWSDGVARFLQGTKAEPNTFRLEGWDTVNGITTWKSVKFWVYGDCGPF